MGGPWSPLCCGGEGKAGLVSLVGWMSVLCQGDIQSQQDVLSVPTEIIELKLQQHNRGVPGGEKRMGKEIFFVSGALEAAAASKHRQVISKLFRGMKLLVMFLFPEWVLFHPCCKNALNHEQDPAAIEIPG